MIRLLIVAQEKGLDLREVLTYPLSSVPSAVANSDGSMAKTTKSTILHEIEKQVPESTALATSALAADTVLIIDALAMIQQQRSFPETFGQFAKSLFQQVVAMSLKYHARRVDFVADRYPDVSSKQHEREKRAIHGESRVTIQRPDQKMAKQMKKFLSCGANKERLISFIVQEWENCVPPSFSKA